MNLDAIEARANAATPGPWAVYEKPDPWGYWAVQDADGKDVFDDGSAGAEYGQTCSIADRDFLVAARTDVPALVARVRELEAECERTRIFGSRKFAELRAADVEQMRGYGLSYEGVRKVLREHDDGEISFGKLMDLIRAAARAMAEDECAEMRVLLADAHRELATIEAITVSPSGVDGLMELVNRMGQKLEADK
jgi:hypothetical protein